MRTSRVVLLAVLAALLGSGIGWFASGRVYGGVFTEFVSMGAFIDVNHSYSTIKALRAGDTNEALDLLEARMDGDVMVLSTLLEEVAPEDRKPTRVRLLQLVKEYRDEYPRITGEPEIDQAVDEALSLGDGRSQE